MIAYKRDEIISASKITRNFSSVLNALTNKSKDRYAISKNNKLEAIILDIDEYEKLQNAYDILEQKEIDSILKNRTIEEKQISHSKIVEIDV